MEVVDVMASFVLAAYIVVVVVVFVVVVVVVVVVVQSNLLSTWSTNSKRQYIDKYRRLPESRGMKGIITESHLFA